MNAPSSFRVKSSNSLRKAGSRLEVLRASRPSPNSRSPAGHLSLAPATSRSPADKCHMSRSEAVIGPDHRFSCTPALEFPASCLMRLQPCGVVGEAACERPFRLIAEVALRLPCPRTALGGQARRPAPVRSGGARQETLAGRARPRRRAASTRHSKCCRREARMVPARRGPSSGEPQRVGRG
jgi:hypothetical protein